MPERPGRRLPVLIGAGAALAILVAVIVVAGSGGADPGDAAPAECVDRWNESRNALAYGRHNYGAHGYERVQVTMLTESAREPAEGEPGACAVIFGALEPDTEPPAAGQLLDDGAWTPIALQEGVTLNRVAELQAIAAGEANASLDGEGKLVAR